MRREPAHNLMREEQVSQQRAERIQKRQVREQIVEVRTTNAHLAPVFTARFLRSLLRTNGAIHKRTEITLLQNLRRHKEVVHDALLDRKFRIKFTTNSIKGAVATNQAVKHTFELLDFTFQIPVRAFALAKHTSALVRKNQVTASATNFLVLERVHKLTHHIREEHRICIAEQQNIVLCNFLQAVQHGSLASIFRSLDQSNSLIGIAGDNFCRLVRRAVIANQNLKLFLGVVNFKNIVDLAFNHRFFVISRNQDRHRREFGGAVHRLLFALEDFTHKRERHRKQQIAVNNQEQKNPECNLSIKEYIFTHFEIHSFSFSRIW